MGTIRNKNLELADLTVSMLLNLAYFLAICWIFPVIPMVIVLMCGFSFTFFLTLWLIGSACSGLVFFYFYRTRK